MIIISSSSITIISMTIITVFITILGKTYNAMQ